MEKVRCFLCGATFGGSVQQALFSAEAAVGDGPPGSLEQFSPLLGHCLPTADGEVTPSPSGHLL